MAFCEGTTQCPRLLVTTTLLRGQLRRPEKGSCTRVGSSILLMCSNMQSEVPSQRPSLRREWLRVQPPLQALPKINRMFNACLLSPALTSLPSKLWHSEMLKSAEGSCFGFDPRTWKAETLGNYHSKWEKGDMLAGHPDSQQASAASTSWEVCTLGGWNRPERLICRGRLVAVLLGSSRQFHTACASIL